MSLGLGEGTRTAAAAVAPGNYFVLGDNRLRSCDSRMWGTVPRNDLIGPVALTYWPPKRLSFR